MPFVIKSLMDMSKEEDPKALIKAFRDGFGVTLTTNGDVIAPSMDEMTTFIAAAVENSREAGIEDEGLDKYYLERVEEIEDAAEPEPEPEPDVGVVDATDGFNEIEEDQLYDMIMEMPKEQREAFLRRFDPDIKLPEVATEEPEQQLGAVDIMQRQKPKSGNSLAKLIGNLKF